MENLLHKSTSCPCSQCGKQYSNGEMLEFEGDFICFNCKPVFIQKLKEGVPISSKASRSIWWKAYFFIFLTLVLLAFNSYFYNLLAGEKLIESISSFVVTPWVLVAIFGYSFNRKFFVRKVWEMLFPIVIITDILSVTLSYMSFSEQNGPGQSLFIFVVIYVLFAPLLYFQYLALYRYGFSKNEPWEEHIHNKE